MYVYNWTRGRLVAQTEGGGCADTGCSASTGACQSIAIPGVWNRGMLSPRGSWASLEHAPTNAFPRNRAEEVMSRRAYIREIAVGAAGRV
jgi:hypothetical protein